VGVIPSVVTVIFNARGAFNTLGDVFKLPGMTKEAAQVLADYATVGTASSNTGLININTASEAVLDTIPNMDPDIAQSILDRQETGFKGLGELGNVPGVDLPTYAAIINRFCVGSRSFTVRVIGTAGSTRVAMEAILTFDDKGKVSVSREQPVLAGDVRSRWGWATMTANQEVVAEPW
jgi:type II secretory pathway component PulK